MILFESSSHNSSTIQLLLQYLPWISLKIICYCKLRKSIKIHFYAYRSQLSCARLRRQVIDHCRKTKLYIVHISNTNIVLTVLHTHDGFQVDHFDVTIKRFCYPCWTINNSKSILVEVSPLTILRMHWKSTDNVMGHVAHVCYSRWKYITSPWTRDTRERWNTFLKKYTCILCAYAYVVCDMVNTAILRTQSQWHYIIHHSSFRRRRCIILNTLQ